MRTRNAFMLLAIGVLLAGLSGLGMANDQGMLSDDPSAQSDAWQIREAMETGSFPDRLMGSSDAYSNAAGDEPTVEAGGVTFRPDIDAGP